MGTAYASGNWQVKAGKEAEFEERWSEFLDYTRGFSGFGSALLLRDHDEPGHYLSESDWDSHEQIMAWRTSAGFAPRFQACTSLCDNFDGKGYDEAASVTAAEVIRT